MPDDTTRIVIEDGLAVYRAALRAIPSVSAEEARALAEYWANHFTEAYERAAKEARCPLTPTP